MTDKEAKAILIDKLKPCLNGTEWEMALDIAIKALEQEPCEDAISKQALYESLYESFHDEDAPNNITQVTLGAVRNFVKNFPPATPQPKPKTDVLDKIRAEIEQLPTKTRTNWDGCCPDIDYPEIEYVDVTKKQLLQIIDKYKAERSEE